MFNINVMLGEKEKLCMLANKFQGIEPVYMLQILGTSVKILGKLKTVLEILRNSTWGLRVDKRRFKLLHFKNKTISFTYTPLFQYATTKFFRDVFRILSNIYDGTFWHNYFRQEAS